MATKTEKLAEYACEREKKLRAERTPIDTQWQDIARYVLPRKATFTEESSPGVERTRSILDSTAPRSLELFSSFLHTLLNNPSTQWFELSVRNPFELNEVVAIKQWREETAKRMLSVMGGESMNLYSALHETYLDLGAFGTSCMFMEALGGRPVSRNYHMADVAIDENIHGIVDSVFRQFRASVRQIKQRWPAYDVDKKRDKQNEGLRLLHVVVPASDKEVQDLLPERSAAQGFPFISLWIDAEKKQLLQEPGGYEEFPYMIPRWYKVRGDKYGRSPGMTALPDIRMVNRMMETILRGAEKLVDPPLLIPDGGLISPIRLFPGGISFSDGAITPQPLIPPGASRIEYGDALLQRRQEAIREAFFVPFFVTPEAPVKTATQVLQETDERNRAVSPMLVRLQAELFHRFVMRTYGIMQRLGQIPPPPPELQEAGAELAVEYISPLMASQRQLEALGVVRIFEGLAGFAQIDPGVFDVFEPDEAARVVHAGSGAPASLLRSEAKVREVRQARAEQAQQEAALQQASQITDVVEAGAKVAQATNGRQR